MENSWRTSIEMHDDDHVRLKAIAKLRQIKRPAAVLDFSECLPLRKSQHSWREKKIGIDCDAPGVALDAIWNDSERRNPNWVVGWSSCSGDDGLTKDYQVEHSSNR